MALTQVPIELSSTPGIVDNSNATAITIDSSENVLVGTTSTAVSSSTGSVTGAVVNNTGLFEAAKTGTVMELNRLTADGTILNFRKDGTTVGSIGGGATFLTIGSGTGNVYFQNGVMAPTASSGGASSNGVIDIGTSSSRFKDLYLSGGAYLGGTGSANYLNDYEEGTWTPILKGDTGSASGQSYGVVTAHYVKVGQLVYLGFDFELTAAGSTSGAYAVIGNLPFPALTSNLGGGNLGYYTNLSNTTGPITFYVAASQAYLMEGNNTYVARTDISNTTRLIGFLSYRTSA